MEVCSAPGRVGGEKRVQQREVERCQTVTDEGGSRSSVWGGVKDIQDTVEISGTRGGYNKVV